MIAFAVLLGLAKTVRWLQDFDCLPHAKRSVFLYGFAKSARDNIDEDDLADLKKQLLALDEDGLALAIEQDELIEVQHEENG